jgi:hypothetical protein
MAGEIISMLAQATPPAARLDEPLQGSAPAAEAARFSQLMSPDAPGAAPPQAPEAVSPASQAQAARMETTGAALGDRILRGMQAAGRGYVEHASKAHSVLDGGAGALTTSDMLRLQFHMTESSLMVDLFSKLTQKFTQHINELTKVQ